MCVGDLNRRLEQAENIYITTQDHGYYKRNIVSRQSPEKYTKAIIPSPYSQKAIFCILLPHDKKKVMLFGWRAIEHSAIF